MRKSERLQVLIEPGQLRALRKVASNRKVSVATVVRACARPAIGDGRLEATTTVLALQEVAYAAARRRLIDVTAARLDCALALVERHGLRPSDAIIAR